MRKILTYIKSIDFAVTLCALAMAGQSFHTYYAFYDTSKTSITLGRIVESGLFVIVFEFFTLFYLLRGRINMAKFYSICQFIINVYYYLQDGFDGMSDVMGIFLSAIIPISIYFVAEEVKKEFEVVQQENAMEALLEKLQSQVKEKNKSIKL